MPRERFEFRLFDASNIERLFVNGDDALSSFDGVFISTNVTSDRQALEALNGNIRLLSEEDDVCSRL
jgi:hypothetical protein